MRPLSLALAFCIALVALPAQTAIAPGPIDASNILLLVADDMGVGSIRAYGVGTGAPPTPNLDALAARGVLFRAAYSNPLCSPTRACFHTGRYSFRTGVGNVLGNNALPLRETTLAEVLAASGAPHRAAVLGKWHLGDASNGGALAPNRAGYGHFAGSLPGQLPDYYAWSRTVNGSTAPSTTYATTHNVDDALAWIRTAPQPWVCLVNFNAPHSPWHTPPAALHTYNLAGLDPGTTPRPFYKAAIQAMDTEIGRLLRGLGRTLASTDVFFLGDNGTPGEVIEAPYTAARGKGTTYEGGIHVPLLAAGPSVWQGGREVTALVGAVDLFATFCELAGVQPARVLPPGTTLDGISFVRHLRLPDQPAARTLAFAEVFAGTTPATNGSSALRNARYKLIRFYRTTGSPLDEFYDLQADPYERADLLLGTLTPVQRANYIALRTATEQLRASP